MPWLFLNGYFGNRIENYWIHWSWKIEQDWNETFDWNNSTLPITIQTLNCKNHTMNRNVISVRAALVVMKWMKWDDVKILMKIEQRFVFGNTFGWDWWWWCVRWNCNEFTWRIFSLYTFCLEYMFYSFQRTMRFCTCYLRRKEGSRNAPFRTLTFGGRREKWSATGALWTKVLIHPPRRACSSSWTKVSCSNGARTAAKMDASNGAKGSGSMPCGEHENVSTNVQYHGETTHNMATYSLPAVLWETPCANYPLKALHFFQDDSRQYKPSSASVAASQDKGADPGLYATKCNVVKHVFLVLNKYIHSICAGKNDVCTLYTNAHLGGQVSRTVTT